MDALVSARTDGENDTTRRLKNELLVRMSEAAQGVLVLAATNVPWDLDPAVRRRFERRIHVPLPEAEARATLLRIHLGTTPHQLGAREVLQLATQLDGFSGSDLSVLVCGTLREPCNPATLCDKPYVVEAATLHNTQAGCDHMDMHRRCAMR